MYTQTKKAAAIFIFSTLFGAIVTLTVSAAPQTGSGTINVDGAIIGPPPTTAPTIEIPIPNTTFTTKSITVKGSCIVNLIVKVYRNGFFAGSALCQTDGTYSLAIDLFLGANDLVARQFDSANQASPDSNKVLVFYSPTPPPSLPDTPPSPSTIPQNHTETPGESPSGAAQFQLVIEYDYTLQSLFVNNPFHLPVTFAGGTGPYAVNINWGDETNDVSSRSTTDPFSLSHTYTTPGYYTVSISVSDKNGDKASLQFVLLVNGKAPESALDSVLGLKNEWWWQAAQVGIFIVSIVSSFLLGRHSRRANS